MKISKYQNRILAMVTFFVFFFGLITVIYSDSYQNTLEEQRKKLYGSWNIASYHTSDDEIQTLEKNATIDKVKNSLKRRLAKYCMFVGSRKYGGYHL